MNALKSLFGRLGTWIDEKSDQFRNWILSIIAEVKSFFARLFGIHK